MPAKTPKLGPKSWAMLARIGIASLDDLRTRGAVQAFADMRRAGVREASLNLLWAMVAALEGRDWKAVAREDRLSLLLALENTEGARARRPD